MHPPTDTKPAARREAHGHLLSLAESLSLIHLTDCPDLASCLELIRSTAAKTPANTWLRLASARVNAWPEGRWPTLAELDAAAPDHPLVILSFDYHCAVANSRALAACNLAPGQIVNTKGLVHADESTNLPTGLLIEDAAYVAWRAAPAPSPGQHLDQLRAAIAHLRAFGFVEVHDLHAPAALGPMLHQLDQAGELPLNIHLYAPFAEITAIAAGRAAFETPRIHLTGAKIFLDGTLNARTALMLHRYAEPIPGHPRGQCMIPPLQLDDIIRSCASQSLQLAVHAIGDGAVRTMLDSVQRVAPDRNRVRIEHAEIIDAMDVPRFAALGVSASVQPCHLLSDIEALNRFVPHRLNRVLPLRDLLNSGLKPGHFARPGDPDSGFLFGSDVPIVRANPEDSIQAAVHRRREISPVEDAIAPAQALTEAEAWSCFAIN